MKTVQQIYNKTFDTLKTIYNEMEAKNITKILLADLLKLNSPSEIFLYFNNTFYANKEKCLELKLKKLTKNYPLQYVTHKAEFAGLNLFVFPGVFIPRPETEELCTIIEKTLDNNKNYKIIDLCTGSGCIAIALKKKFKNSTIFATDINEFALKVANCNAKYHKTDINFIKDDILNVQYNYPFFDVIVSNPPYVPYSYRLSVPENVKYEPFDAIFVPDTDVLIFYKAIFNFANKFLFRGGYVFLELHENYYNEVKQLFEVMYTCFIFKDFRGQYRFVKAIKNE
ncbi:MAG: peptide chain release factor N(5)-glutamine methyltransferase [Bacteroidales bacterium]|nr:peptide chain release factor N(5)-glutamine methyltransferase [Bacteroidales bacterium]